LRPAAKMAPAESGEKATSFAMACSLLSRYVRQNGAAAADLGLAIRGEASSLVEEKFGVSRRSVGVLYLLGV
jgi:hypothetical protein